jgi:rRNA maturation endonuclease Nob1
MVKANSVRVNMRLKDDARFALEELSERLGMSQTAVVEQLVIAAHSGGEGGDGAVQKRESAVQSDPAEIAGVERGVKPNAFCVHCERKFMGPKGASICPACGGGGHVSSGECRRCAQMAHAKELASSPTAAEGVDYDWQDPI